MASSSSDGAAPPSVSDPALAQVSNDGSPRGDAARDEESFRLLVRDCTSNAELAGLSLTSGRIVVEEIRDALLLLRRRRSAAGDEGMVDVGDQDGDEDGDGEEEGAPPPPPLAKLLLPEMAAELMLRTAEAQAAAGEEVKPASSSSPTAAADADADASKVSAHRGRGQFCLAWFAPRGIQISGVRVGGDSDDESDSSSDCEREQSQQSAATGSGELGISDSDHIHQAALRGGHGAGVGAMNAADTVDLPNMGGGGFGVAVGRVGGASQSAVPAAVARAKRLNKKSAKRRSKKKGGRHRHKDEGRVQTCSHEWSGYTEASEVLKPFGYEAAFVEKVLSVARKIGRGEDVEEMEEHSPAESAPPASPFANLLNIDAAKKSAGGTTAAVEGTTTFAVRGATLARPEGYCPCWDRDDAAVVAVLGADTTSDPSLSRRERRRERRERQKLLLPRVVSSTRHKNPHLMGEISASGSKRQRCVQFLNSDGSHAVRLRTPPFECGPVSSPVTIFLVGIATEDGCFMSGLKKRFEVGHLYPIDPRDNLIDRSPVCMAVEEGRAGDDADGAAADTLIRSESASALIEAVEDSSDEGRTPTTCSCTFKCRHRMLDPNRLPSEQLDDEDDDDENAPDEAILYRGTMGPGLWHCYTAIFDGANSVIRVDGGVEPAQLDEYEANVRSSSKWESSCAAAVLDGLTIGSDHPFDMSLCYGEGERREVMQGEGEGAVAELAVFRGRLDEEDVRKMERYLMERHGIVTATAAASSPGAENAAAAESSTGQPTVALPPRHREDEWSRQAHALIVQPPPFKLRCDEPIPLRAATRHASVSWHRTCEVTGRVIPVSRIGSKVSKGSSDW